MQDENRDPDLGELTQSPPVVLPVETKVSPASLKNYLSLLLICIFYAIGWDLLLFHISQTNPDLDLYPLATIYLYLRLFYLTACICLLPFIFLYFIAYSLKNYALRPFWRHFARAFRSQFLTRPQVYGALYMLLVIPLFFAFVGLYKQLIPIMNPFSWDQTLMHWDYVLHFHHQPWEWLQPLVGYRWITAFLAEIYGFWFTMLAGVIIWQALTKERFYRLQFFSTFFLSWIILGTIMAYSFSSAGPCFYSLFSNDMQNPYAPLMSYLSANGPAWIIELQKSLLANLMSGTLIFGGGVSAMPSMHLSMATLCFLISAKESKWLGIFTFVILILIFISSIHLGWHYAVDCYVAIIITALIWSAMGKILRRLQA